jgi:hypothetical protein
MSLSPLCKARYIKNKRAILKLLKNINNDRQVNSIPNISPKIIVIKKLIVLCKFTMQLKKLATAKRSKTSKFNKIYQKPTYPVQIEKGGFIFILNQETGKYKRLPKKEFNLDEVNKWGTSRKRITQVRQNTNKLKEEQKKVSKREQEKAIKNILSREINSYPNELRSLISISSI